MSLSPTHLDHYPVQPLSQHLGGGSFRGLKGLGCVKNFVTCSSSCGHFRALVSHRGYVIGTPSFICASQMVSLSPPHLICQSFLLPFSRSSCLNCHTLVKLQPFPCPHLTSWLCHWHPILYLCFTDGRSRWSLFPTSYNLSIVPAPFFALLLFGKRLCRIAV